MEETQEDALIVKACRGEIKMRAPNSQPDAEQVLAIGSEGGNETAEQEDVEDGAKKE